MIRFKIFLLESISEGEKNVERVKKMYPYPKGKEAADIEYEPKVNGEKLFRAASHADYEMNIHLNHVYKSDPVRDGNHWYSNENFNAKVNSHVIDKLAQADPSKDKKHLEQITHWYANRYFKAEDMGSEESHKEHPNWNTVYGTLKAFSDIKNKDKLTDIPHPTNPGQFKKGTRISSYSHMTFPEFRDHIHEKLGLNQAGGEFEHPDAPLIHDKDGVKVHEVNSKSAAIHLGKCTGAKWCTGWEGRDNQFEHYHDQGKLLHVETPDKNHWQFHFETGSFADKNDHMHEPHELVKQYPELKDVEAFKQHGAASLPFTKNSEEAHTLLDKEITGSRLGPERMETETARSFIKHAHNTNDPSLLDHMIWGKHHGIDPKNPPDDVRNTSAHFDLSRPNISSLIGVGEPRHVHVALDLLDRKSHPGRNMDTEYEEAAKTGHKSVLDRLINHKSAGVREQIAYNGDESHHDQLVSDSSHYVRAAVAQKSKKHFETLRHDPNDVVRSVAIHNHATQSDLDQHYKDTSERVQEAVVKKTNNPVHLDYLRKYGLRSTIKGHAEHKYWAIKGAEDGQAASNP